MPLHRDHGFWHTTWGFIRWRVTNLGINGFLLFGLFGVGGLAIAAYQLVTGSFQSAALSLGIALPVVALFYLPALWRLGARRLMGNTVDTPWVGTR